MSVRAQSTQARPKKKHLPLVIPDSTTSQGTPLKQNEQFSSYSTCFTTKHQMIDHSIVPPLPTQEYLRNASPMMNQNSSIFGKQRKSALPEIAISRGAHPATDIVPAVVQHLQASPEGTESQEMPPVEGITRQIFTGF